MGGGGGAGAGEKCSYVCSCMLVIACIDFNGILHTGFRQQILVELVSKKNLLKRFKMAVGNEGFVLNRL